MEDLDVFFEPPLGSDVTIERFDNSLPARIKVIKKLLFEEYDPFNTVDEIYVVRLTAKTNDIKPYRVNDYVHIHNGQSLDTYRIRSIRHNSSGLSKLFLGAAYE